MVYFSLQIYSVTDFSGPYLQNSSLVCQVVFIKRREGSCCCLSKAVVQPHCNDSESSDTQSGSSFSSRFPRSVTWCWYSPFSVKDAQYHRPFLKGKSTINLNSRCDIQLIFFKLMMTQMTLSRFGPLILDCCCCFFIHSDQNDFDFKM